MSQDTHQSVSLRDRLLTIFFAALFLLNVGYLLLSLASIPLYYERVTNLTLEPYRIGDQDLISNATVQSEAAERGMNLSQYALEQILFGSVLVLGFGIVALLIVRGAGWNWFAWYTAFFLVFVSGSALQNQVFAARLVPLVIYEANSVFWSLVLLYLYLFPNGKPVPRFALIVFIPYVLIHALFQLTGAVLSVVQMDALAQTMTAVWGTIDLLIPFVILLGLACQIYRYLRVSNGIEKQQTKWFLFGLTIALLLSTLPSIFLGDQYPFSEEADFAFFIFVPFGVAIAILRYRLWDIDILIRRTLTYAIVTALLLVVFFGSVILLQQVFASLTGSGQNELVTVLSTLAIAALFVPLRNRIQNLIDRRFNRRKYDAQQILNEFGNTVRDETDLESLTQRLVQVIDRTMQPKLVDVWLKPKAKVLKTGQSSHE